MTSPTVPPSTAQPGTASPATRPWLAWLLVMTLSSLIIALAAGIFVALDGGTRAQIALTGGGAFVASVSVLLSLLQAAKILRGDP